MRTYPFWKKSLFIFVVSFLGLPALTSFLENFIGFDPYSAVVPFVGKYVLGIDTPLEAVSNGSGDSLFSWVTFFAQFLVAILLTGIYLLIDRKPRDFSRPFEFLWIFLRYYLIMMLFVYGFAKVFYQQMPAPSLGRLLQPYGESSPMGLLWTFVGYSKYYSAFVGWSEVIPGILLLFRRTALLGAIIAAIVMLNVFVLNMCFDVPVKIYSFFLLMIAVAIAMPGIQRLWKVFVTHEALDAVPMEPFFSNRHLNLANNILKGLVIVGIVGLLAYDYAYNLSGSDQKPAFYGIWDVTGLKRNNQPVAPLLTDSTYWRKFIVTYQGYAGIRMANDTIRRFEYKMDTLQQTFTIHPAKDTLQKYTLKYTKSDPENMVFSGLWGGDTLEVTLKRFDEQRFLLVRRGFHWVNETPYNR
jgi:hypothetical protein